MKETNMKVYITVECIKGAVWLGVIGAIVAWVF